MGAGGDADVKRLMAVWRHIPGGPGLWRRLSGWPWLIGPLAVVLLAVVAAVASRGSPALMTAIRGPAQRIPDEAAPFIVAAATCLYAARAAVTRNRLYLILTALSAALLLREIHFEWTHRGVYVMLGAVGVWALAWRRRLDRPLRDVRHTSWLLATLGTYALAFLIYRRAFRFVPGEQAVHNFMEENIELVAHLMLLATSLLGTWRRHYRRRAAPVAAPGLHGPQKA